MFIEVIQLSQLKFLLLLSAMTPNIPLKLPKAVQQLPSTDTMKYSIKLQETDALLTLK